MPICLHYRDIIIKKKVMSMIRRNLQMPKRKVQNPNIRAIKLWHKLCPAYFPFMIAIRCLQTYLHILTFIYRRKSLMRSLEKERSVP